jgi:phage terminase large subunit
MLLTQPQSEIFLDESRFRVVVAGRRFGKTHLATVELLRAALDGKGKNCWYVAPTYKAAKEIAWDMLMQIIPQEYIDKKNETSLSINLLNGSTISLKGAEHPDSLRGRALDFCIMDEFADMKPQAWTEVLRPSLADREGNAIWIGTPKGRNHFYDLWTKGIDGEQGWSSFQFTTLQGGNVSAEEIESARRDLDERTFKQEFEAAFVNYAGIIYYNFSREQSVAPDIAPGSHDLFIGLDFNIDPMSAVVAIRQGQAITVIDEIVLFGSNTDEMVDEIKTRYPNNRISIYPDPASRQRKTSAGGRTDLSILQNAGFSVYVRNAHPSVRDRINAVNSRLLSADGKRNLFVTPKCKKTISSLERQTYKEGTSQPDKESGFDHMNDALGYMVEFLYPIRRRYEAEQPTRWT